MTKMTKILLVVSLSAFALGFTGILWGFGRPVGAICFGLFMISKLLEKETALYDQEQRLRLAEAMRALKQIPSENLETPTLSMSQAVAHSR
jgi:nicotinamide mononucleotide (NMN) deamidase PncC